MSPKRCLLIVLALLTCTVAGCNSRIGWPPLEFSGVAEFLVVCALFFGGFQVVLSGEDKRASILCGAVMWLVAALVLQRLPHAESGLQIVPLLPWQYCGWFGRLASAICWWRLIVACYCIPSAKKLDWLTAGHGLLIGFALTCVLSFCSLSETAPVDPESHPAFVQSCQAKIEQWERLRDERQEALQKLAMDRSVLIGRIRGLGVTSKRDLMEHAVGSTLAQELEHLSQQIAHLQAETDAIVSVLERSESTLRRIEREAMIKGLGVSAEAKYDQLSLMDHQLREELRKLAGPPMLGSEVRLDKVLDGVFTQGGEN